MLDDRKSRVLRILVEEHVRTGEPVSSRAILQYGHLGVSAATVRNELAILEAEGYAVQPHTSAGRIPTAHAYRYYVDQLIRPSRFPNASARVSEFFASVHNELGRLLKATSSLLSEITHYPSVVTGPGLSQETVRAIHLVQIRVDAVVMVVVTQGGRVSKSLLNLPNPVGAAEVEDAELFLRRHHIGQSMPQGLGRDQVPAGEIGSGAETIIRQATEALGRAGSTDRELYVGPASCLTDAWGEISKVRGVLEVLEREAALFEVMAHLPEGTEVRIGRELGIDSTTDISLVSSSYGGDQGGPQGRIGVLGPMRMDYGRTISVVEEISGGLGESLGSAEA
ncbi:MAG: heat-inducible transcriptional repressor HrcA [bacterium]|nr:heat-inducible transcriptional repressor HrcA [bacterium]MDE0288290.1 heat-inducible transcriptional repressor HrcA [bacterium]MDE0437308.1 heat-inducible transcriptional repressor HrcA [bacterium]